MSKATKFFDNSLIPACIVTLSISTAAILLLAFIGVATFSIEPSRHTTGDTLFTVCVWLLLVMAVLSPVIGLVVYVKQTGSKITLRSFIAVIGSALVPVAALVALAGFFIGIQWLSTIPDRLDQQAAKNRLGQSNPAYAQKKAQYAAACTGGLQQAQYEQNLASYMATIQQLSPNPDNSEITYRHDRIGKAISDCKDGYYKDYAAFLANSESADYYDSIQQYAQQLQSGDAKTK